MRLLQLLFFLAFILYGPIALSQTFTSSNLPIVIIETNGQTIPDEPKINVDMGIIYNGPGQMNYITDPYNEYDGIVGIERRGNSSQYYFPKKQYAFETRDSLSMNLNVSLLGMPEENDWILHAPYSDKTLMRNVLAYKMASDLGDYASRTAYCEVVINGDYKGVYVLMEKIKRDVNRVNITELDENDIAGDSLTGGYMVKIDKTSGVNSQGWYSNFPPYPGAWQQVRYQYHYPKASVIQEEQKEYIEDFIYDFESVMYGANYNDPETGYPAIIDINSFSNVILINELGKNVDAYRLSAFLYKDRNSINGRLFAGPVWDLNLAFGNANYYGGYDPQNWMITSHASFGEDYILPFWWEKLMEDPAFYQHLVLHWNIYRQHILHTDTIMGFIDNTAEYLEEARQRNFERWPIIGEYVWPNYFVGNTYEEELLFFKNWILSRIDWMDEQLELQPIITEINYHSSPDLDAGDWIEIYNPADEDKNLSYWELRDGNEMLFFFPLSTILPAQSYMVICENVTQFLAVHPTVINCMGNMNMGLNNEGQIIELFRPGGFPVDMLVYTNDHPWPLNANGTGKTIELNFYLIDNSNPYNWHTSFMVGGSPGEGAPVPEIPALYINELMADNVNTVADESGDYDDWIELYNGSEIPIDVGGMYICDNLKNIKYKIPQTNPEVTTILCGGFLLLWADNELEEGILHLNFKLSTEEDQIELFMPNEFTKIDSVSFTDQEQDISYGRLTDGGEEWTLCEVPTPNFTNSSGMGIKHSNQLNLTLFPNPANQFFKVELPNEYIEFAQLELFDMYGKRILSQRLDTKINRIDVSVIDAGLYIVVIFVDEEKIIEKLTILNNN